MPTDAELNAQLDEILSKLVVKPVADAPDAFPALGKGLPSRSTRRIAAANERTERAHQERDAAVTAQFIAQERAEQLEAIIKDVWRWTNDGAPHLGLLTPILLRADDNYSVIAALDAIGFDPATHREKRNR